MKLTVIRKDEEEKITLSKKFIKPYVEQGYVSERRHPYLPLSIYCYTQKTEIENNWDYITLHCRGLILDDDDRIVFNCPEKFFNKDQNETARLVEEAFSKIGYEVYEKLDGSAIWVVNDKKYGLVVASKSSFESDQARLAKKLLYSKKYVKHLEEGKCYCFELISPKNQIVIKYDYEDLILWGVKSQDSRDDEYNIYKDAGMFDAFKKVKKYKQGYETEYIKKNNVEGVVLLTNLGHNVKRIKLKSEEYLALHKIATGATKLNVWRILSSGSTIEEFSKEHQFPDEWLENLKEYQSELTREYQRYDSEIRKWYHTLYEIRGMSLKGIFLNTSLMLEPWVKNGIAALSKGHEDRVNEMIWKMIRPNGNELNN